MTCLGRKFCISDYKSENLVVKNSNLRYNKKRLGNFFIITGN